MIKVGYLLAEHLQYQSRHTASITLVNTDNWSKTEIHRTRNGSQIRYEILTNVDGLNCLEDSTKKNDYDLYLTTVRPIVEFRNIVESSSTTAE